MFFLRDKRCEETYIFQPLSDKKEAFLCEKYNRASKIRRNLL